MYIEDSVEKGEPVSANQGGASKIISPPGVGSWLLVGPRYYPQWNDQLCEADLVLALRLSPLSLGRDQILNHQTMDSQSEHDLTCES